MRKLKNMLKILKYAVTLDSEEFVDIVLKENRRVLALLHPSDVRDVNDMSQDEQREHVAEIARVFSSEAFQNELRWLTQKQTEFIARESRTWEEAILGRGNINGLGLLYDRLLLLDGMHKQNVEKKEEPGTELFPEL